MRFFDGDVVVFALGRNAIACPQQNLTRGSLALTALARHDRGCRYSFRVAVPANLPHTPFLIKPPHVSTEILAYSA